MIRACTEADFEEIYTIINDAAIAYQGVIPNELWKEPFVSRSYLASEIQAGVTFTGYQQNGALLGVMGTQQKDDVLLIRHSYIRTSHRRTGIGSALLQNHLAQTDLPVLVGCLKAMTWAISFYQKHGFILVSESEKDRLRAKYWSLSSTHVGHSVVLANQEWLNQEQNLLPLIQVCLVLRLLKKPSQSVKELAENIDFCQTTVRKHLAKLEEWKVVKTESWQPTRYFIPDNAPQDFIRRCHAAKSEYKISLFLRCLDS